jgi:16S rRNA (uracil1498-N3)-methyltransferase
MALPFFYKQGITESDPGIVLDEDSSKHIVQVLRMQAGELLKLTDGIGHIFTCEITDDHRKRCMVKILETQTIEKSPRHTAIAISPVKNNSRFEWFLEKATEIGINEIIPLVCERTEKSQLKTERLTGILVSAMLQSQQAWLPVLQESVKFKDYIGNQSGNFTQKMIAHCLDDRKTLLSSVALGDRTLILIGPEGDFTTAEISLALEQDFEPVSLGATRLRTETAGMVSAVLLTTSH